jgi:outer membrane protein assembly factor BamB
MRKIVQKQIMDMIPAIWDGVQYIQTAEPENAQRVLQDCLLAMETLRESLRSGLSEIRFAYYQNFYDQAFLSLANIERGINPANQIPEIYTGLDTILTDITDEKEVKLEILFLPYKASMWDSLESIWLAAKDDSKCDAYVMPIPYCDRNPDGSPLEWHCEADLFPEYVPVTDFHQYDIAKRKPDAVYIHNPYDEYNRVTSVDPKYYSSELKKHTDMLVYVPYFVSGDKIEPHFCQVAGVINADKVIVESEEIKKQYELAYPGGNPPENKFLALGSPKFDKVLNSSRADFILPKKWQGMMQGKKVILYNTSLAAMLENPSEANNKLRHVLSVFKNRKDVILWWRPHPLIKATMQSMHPEIFHEYENIEQEYKSVGWGIYDDSVDLHRAISWSDAYYGDPSSLVWMYGVTGKPIMLQNIEVLETNRDAHNLYFDCMETDGEKVWFIPFNIKGLFQMDLKTNQIEFLGGFPGEVLNQEVRCYHSLIKIKNKIIIAPWCGGNAIIEYDLDLKQFVRTEIHLNEYIYQDNHNMFSGKMAVYKNNVFMWGAHATIIKYNIDTRACKYYSTSHQLLRESYDSRFGWFSMSCCIKDDILLIPLINRNIVFEFNMDTGKYKLHNIGSNQHYLLDIAFDGNDYWFTQTKGKNILKWNYKTGNVMEYESFPSVNNSNMGNGETFSSILFDGTDILLFLARSNFVINVNKNTGEMVKNEILSREFIIPNDKRINGMALMYDQNILFALNLKSNELIEINTRVPTISRHTLKMSNVLYQYIWQRTFSESGRMFLECRYGNDLIWFLNDIMQLVMSKICNDSSNKLMNINGDSGNKIYRNSCYGIN